MTSRQGKSGKIVLLFNVPTIQTRTLLAWVVNFEPVHISDRRSAKIVQGGEICFDGRRVDTGDAYIARMLYFLKGRWSMYVCSGINNASSPNTL